MYIIYYALFTLFLVVHKPTSYYITITSYLFKGERELDASFYLMEREKEKKCEEIKYKGRVSVSVC